MLTLSVVLWVLFGLVLLTQISVGSLLFSRGRRLGPALLQRTDGSRWFAVVWLVLGLSEILSYPNGESIWLVCLKAGVFGCLAIFWWNRKKFSVHAEGIAFETTVMFWEELEGWSWSSEKGTLLVWSRSSWVRAMSLRSVNGLDTGQAKTAELEALLERFAGGRMMK